LGANLSLRARRAGLAPLAGRSLGSDGSLRSLRSLRSGRARWSCWASGARQTRRTLWPWCWLAAPGKAKCRYDRANVQYLPHHRIQSLGLSSCTCRGAAACSPQGTNIAFRELSFHSPVCGLTVARRSRDPARGYGGDNELGDLPGGLDRRGAVHPVLLWAALICSGGRRGSAPECCL
jgi:hypothetical protein